MANTNVQGLFFPRDETDDFDPSVRLSEVLKLHHEKTLRTYIFFSLSYFAALFLLVLVSGTWEFTMRTSF